MKYSILDLAILKEGHDAADAYKRSLDIARHAESWGYKRFWLAEHHNMPYVGSSAPTVLMGHIAGGTKSIRVGSGGIMLPNHSPLMVAEQIGTLETLYPGRIDLGLGRAPGTDQKTASVLRRGKLETVQEFPQDLEELQLLFSEENLDAPVRAYPAEGLDVPIYLLGSSMDSAVLAAKKGLPYVFASHFAPTYFSQASTYYKQNFKASTQSSLPYLVACLNIVVADTDEEAAYLATSFYQMALGIIRGRSYPLSPLVKNMDEIWSPQEEAAIKQMTQYAFIGSYEKVSKALASFIERHDLDEVMVTTNVFDHEKRLRSLQYTAKAFQSLSHQNQL
ncbi:LLM class flavin-dependent oxidoreductase [Cyclobacterium sp. 1_MG-2023]|uniref:LLM class flavin-dependent oxidoreductase n=1 Tax=Cyclobacterium sp. 1_MG-2023 TaxID=3062681 RepID=UPI0026E27EF3|nr:LLM class flavin-dependent oxidoreductase [Cyclobacterium sp. 1_MG-2023]MDO6437267.1 LLM class flavin-dependent oxidoreductase [Cyclobacterium sp. 1_MG-2023]